jgi:hypothetical protein
VGPEGYLSLAGWIGENVLLGVESTGWVTDEGQ